MALSEVESEERRGAPRDNKGGKFDNREGKEFPGNPDIEDDAPERIFVGLEEIELFLIGLALAKVRIAHGGCFFGEVGFSSGNFGVDFLDGHRFFASGLIFCFVGGL